MPYEMRKPIGPVESNLLNRAILALEEFPERKTVNYILPSPTPVTKPKIKQPESRMSYYTIDRRPVGHLNGKPVLVITLGSRQVMLISPYYRRVVEESGWTPLEVVE